MPSYQEMWKAWIEFLIQRGDILVSSDDAHKESVAQYIRQQEPQAFQQFSQRYATQSFQQSPPAVEHYLGAAEAEEKKRQQVETYRQKQYPYLPQGPATAAPSFYGSEATSPSAAPAGTTSPEVKTSTIAAILNALPDPLTKESINKARRAIMQYLFSIATDDPARTGAEYDVDLAMVYLDQMAGDITAGAAGQSSELARQTALEQLALEREKFAYGKEQDVLNRQQAILNEQNRVKQALAGLQMQGTGIMSSAYGNALDVYASAARSAIPTGAEYVPGWEPGGPVSYISEKLGTTFNPLAASSGTQIQPYEQLPGLAAAIQQAIAGAR